MKFCYTGELGLTTNNLTDCLALARLCTHSPITALAAPSTLQLSDALRCCSRRCVFVADGLVALKNACVSFVEADPTPQNVCALLSTPVLDVCARIATHPFHLFCCLSLIAFRAVVQFEPEFAITYLEDRAAECAITAAFRSLPRDRIAALLACNHTRTGECDLFRALWRWGERLCERTYKPVTGPSVAYVRGAAALPLSFFLAV